jgi:hypothetical protein
MFFIDAHKMRGFDLRSEVIMMGKGNVYIEPRPGGGFAVEKPGAARASAILPTQRQAIERPGK